ncbi:hypothetical protein ABIB90_003914 [Bradyrhizobium sp. JR4.1]
MNPSAGSLRDLLSREIKTGELVRALIVVGPMVAAYFVARETALLNLGLVAVSLLIPALRLHLPPKVIVWHYIAILLTFAALFLAAPIKPLFAVLTALAGFLAVAVTRHGEHFRTLGNWVFIPAVYLACEVREGVSASEALAPCRHDHRVLSDRAGSGLRHPDLRPATVRRCRDLVRSARGRVVCARGGNRPCSVRCGGAGRDPRSRAGPMGDVVGRKRRGRRSRRFDRQAETAGDRRRRRRAARFPRPQSRVGYALAVLAATLTLIAFSRYIVGFGLRCFFIALAASFAGSASGIAEERIVNVLIGGRFGLLAVALTEIAWLRVMRKVRLSG